ncbi:hypothetical protein [Glaesserella parasuis]|uniref:hypothetical protein n=1 Tax=Glaesserella parasuis TaxID=738 RepID=UPI0024373F5B|nr:hypothetical protein [Glaesserella parasuis]MDG6476647.1 hypothetical protein [Glaesserella parasuis]MDO9664936.1 hypothetical protein [Glaesserella parasuis]
MQILAVNLPLVLSTSGISLACTEVQITDSEKQKSLTGKTAEEALQSLNRDVANANQKLEKQDLQAIQESQEATQIVAEMGAKAVGDLAKMMNWEEGSPQKIALHGLIGYLSAKVGGGNTTQLVPFQQWAVNTSTAKLQIICNIPYRIVIKLYLV